MHGRTEEVVRYRLREGPGGVGGERITPLSLSLNYAGGVVVWNSPLSPAALSRTLSNQSKSEASCA